MTREGLFTPPLQDEMHSWHPELRVASHSALGCLGTPGGIACRVITEPAQGPPSFPTRTVHTNTVPHSLKGCKHVTQQGKGRSVAEPTVGF